MKKRITRREFLKFNGYADVDRQIFISAMVMGGYDNESPRFIPTLEKRPKDHDIGNLCSDSGNLSRRNVQYVADNEGLPFMRLKKNITARAKGYPAWKDMVYRCWDDAERYMKKYHKHAKIEAMMRAVKERFGEEISSKRRWRQKKEILMKIAAYNALRLSFNSF